ncbi:putative Fic family protein [Oenococcus oeni]|uniref:Fic family protein n=1 Tax=Oenococcus oeni TaxID=1247 RepID=A0AAQ2USD4_OENOE|nr:Fic family protein [Oenococcus oeni]SYW06046.1 putative Fic family protein [Oenococcus oeni]VDB98749.1 putative Fic family protein [Oenococcus oeni]
MPYKTLKTIDYEAHHDSKTVGTEYERRIHNYGIFKSGLYPFLIDHQELSQDRRELFVTPLREIAIACERIEYNSAELESKLKELPPIAEELYLKKSLINEITTSNRLSGIAVRRTEVKAALDSINKDNQEQVRFAPMAKMYKKILEGDFQRIESFVDLRKVYNQLLFGLIEKEQMPDGAFFRNRPVSIKNDQHKIIFQLSGNENDLEQRLSNWLKFISNKNIPFMIKGLLAHGYFENIHPFYDGNGRTSRYILSLYLARKLDLVTGLNVAQAIYENRESYEKALLALGDQGNFAEGSFFINDLLSMIENRQRKIIEDLDVNIKQLSRTNKKIQQIYQINSPEYFVLNLLLQSKIFTDNQADGLLDREIVEISENSKHSKRAINLAIKSLERKKQIIALKKNPFQHSIDIN